MCIEINFTKRLIHAWEKKGLNIEEREREKKANAYGKEIRESEKTSEEYRKSRSSVYTEVKD